MGNPNDSCSRCVAVVLDSHKALQCGLCDAWEHAECAKIPEDLYAVLTENASERLIFVCTPCAAKRRRERVSAKRNKVGPVARASSENRTGGTKRSIFESSLQSLSNPGSPVPSRPSSTRRRNKKRAKDAQHCVIPTASTDMDQSVQDHNSPATPATLSLSEAEANAWKTVKPKKVMPKHEVTLPCHTSQGSTNT